MNRLRILKVVAQVHLVVVDDDGEIVDEVLGPLVELRSSDLDGFADRVRADLDAAAPSSPSSP